MGIQTNNNQSVTVVGPFSGFQSRRHYFMVRLFRQFQLPRFKNEVKQYFSLRIGDIILRYLQNVKHFVTFVTIAMIIAFNVIIINTEDTVTVITLSINH